MRIYVGNLTYSVTDDDLRDIFGEYGELASAEVIKDKFSGQSKGFGFVDMPDNGAADTAIKELNESVFKGRKLTVNEARPRDQQSRPRGGGGGGGGGGGWGGGGGRDRDRDGGGREGGGRY
ncbi:RNA-binding protein [uncultured Thiodictyon sp.]|uniref:RNA recognition motif domain-containing protein n=1 Tax=uncultured Thiodictyon sp. TaxID=1846217 RepID=UPI0025E99F2D|nr:RNA-binding protein [uncultured Thiodictyon sp.]